MTPPPFRRITSKGFKPSWSPDGKELVFATEDVGMNPGNWESVGELWLVNDDGSNLSQLPIGADAILPSWSPHGHRIAYTHRLGTPNAKAGLWTIAPRD